MSELQPTDMTLIAAFLRGPDTEKGDRALNDLLARGFTARDLLTYLDWLDALVVEPDEQPTSETERGDHPLNKLIACGFTARDVPTFAELLEALFLEGAKPISE